MKKQVSQNKHRHQWEDHCDCEYCNLEVCVKCGEERDRTDTWRPNSNTKVTQTIHSDGISQLIEKDLK